MPTTIADAAAQFRTGMVDAAVASINDETVQILRGRPGPNQFDDIVSVGAPSARIDPATMTPNRTREMTFTVPVFFSIFRKGGPEAEEVVTERGFELLSALEAYIRVDNITLGGIVRKCECTGWDINDDSVMPTAEGRLLEFPALFEAPVRLTNN